MKICLWKRNKIMFHLKLIFTLSLLTFFIKCGIGTQNQEPERYLIEKEEVIPYLNDLLIKGDTSKVGLTYVDTIRISKLNPSLFSDKDQIKYNLLQYSYFVQIWEEEKFKDAIYRLMESNLLDKDSCQSFKKFLLTFAEEYHKNFNSDPIGYNNTMNSLIILPEEEIIDCSDFIKNESSFNVTIKDN